MAVTMDIEKQALGLTAFITMVWRDQRLEWTVNSMMPCMDLYSVHFYSSNIWTPPIMISNALGSTSAIGDSSIPIEATSDGILTWRFPVSLHTACATEAELFPFDRQTCSFVLEVASHKSEYVAISQDSNITTRNAYPNHEWEIISAWTGIEDTADGRNSGIFTLRYRRYPTAYLLNVLVPILLISVMQPLVFYLPLESGERISYIITLFLTYIWMMTSALNGLPNASDAIPHIAVYLQVLSISGVASIMLAMKNMELYHRPDDIPVSSYVIKIASVIQKLMGGCCTRNHKISVTAEDTEGKSEDGDHPGNDGTKETKNSQLLLWRDVAKTLDRFYFGVMTLYSILLGLAFVGAVGLVSII